MEGYGGMSRHIISKIWADVFSGPGVYLGVDEKIYHSDPLPSPSLSSHVAKIALNRSVRHAQLAHPRFPEPVRPNTAAAYRLERVQAEAEAGKDESPPMPARHLRLGQAAHSLTLGAGAPVVDCKVDKFLTKEAKARRDLVLRNGGIPLNTEDYWIAKDMAAVAKPFITEYMGGYFLPEVMLAWDRNGCWRRALVDILRPDLRAAGDYKTSAMELPPAAAARLVATRNNTFQERFQTAGYDALDPDGIGRRDYFFFVQEVDYPHEITVVESSEALRTKADEQVAGACALWDRAMKSGVFPGYPKEPVYATPTSWQLLEWEERNATDETLNPDEGDDDAA